MSDDRGSVLLPIARAAISEALGEPLPTREDASWLQAPGACFVTLTQQGALRGCIGSLEPYRALLADVKANAVAAALRDPRFAPLQRGELTYTEVEVSLLSAMEPLAFGDEEAALAQLRPGVDGLVLQYGHLRGTFLPQVWEQLPQPRLFMAHLKAKAGLAPDFWGRGVELFRYTVSKWKECELARQAPGEA